MLFKYLTGRIKFQSYRVTDLTPVTTISVRGSLIYKEKNYTANMSNVNALYIA